jgi:hypothetical protein
MYKSPKNATCLYPNEKWFYSTIENQFIPLEPNSLLKAYEELKSGCARDVEQEELEELLNSYSKDREFFDTNPPASKKNKKRFARMLNTLLTVELIDAIQTDREIILTDDLLVKPFSSSLLH